MKRKLNITLILLLILSIVFTNYAYGQGLKDINEVKKLEKKLSQSKITQDERLATISKILDIYLELPEKELMDSYQGEIDYYINILGETKDSYSYVLNYYYYIFKYYQRIQYLPSALNSIDDGAKPFHRFVVNMKPQIQISRVVDSYITLGDIYYTKHENRKAEGYLTYSLDYVEQNRDHLIKEKLYYKKQEQIYCNLAYVYYDLSDFIKTEEYLKKILDKDFKEIANIQSWVDANYLMVDMYIYRGEYAKALEYALGGEEYLEGLGSKYRDYIIDNLMYIAHIYIATNNDRLASQYLEKLTHYTKAGKIYEDEEVNRVYNMHYDILVQSVKALTPPRVSAGFIEGKISKVVDDKEYNTLIKNLATLRQDMAKIPQNHQKEMLGWFIYYIMDMYLAGDQLEEGLLFLQSFKGVLDGDLSLSYLAHYYNGLLSYRKGEYRQAVAMLNRAKTIAQQLEDESFIMDALILRSLCYYQLLDFRASERDALEAISINERVKNNASYMYAYEVLYKSLVEQDRFEEACGAVDNFIAHKDLVINQSSQSEIASMEISHQREISDRKLAEQRRVIIVSVTVAIILGIFLAVVIALYVNNKRLRRRVEIERDKSEKLLLNILPSKVADELKANGYTEPEQFKNVTVYFSDIVNFTKTSSQLEPKTLITELNEIFTKFDDIFEKHNCERIKTIGDAYMGVCGMPQENVNHAENIINAGLEILDYLRQRNKEAQIQWQIRIGIHSGSIVGGVVGVKKYIYDVFGDTVNTASRMESNSEAMKINISQTTYELVKDKYVFQQREEIFIKGKGNMSMYFVEGKIVEEKDA